MAKGLSGDALFRKTPYLDMSLDTYRFRVVKRVIVVMSRLTPSLREMGNDNLHRYCRFLVVYELARVERL